MSRNLAIIHPEERRTPRQPRTPMATRARQVLVALEVIRAKDFSVFMAGDVASEIDQRLAPSNVLPVFYELQHYGALECVTPNQRRYRRWRVVDWARVTAFREALEAGQIEMHDTHGAGYTTTDAPTLPEPAPSRWARVLAWLTTPRASHDAKLEHRVAELESLVATLIDALGGLPSDQQDDAK